MLSVRITESDLSLCVGFIISYARGQISSKTLIRSFCSNNCSNSSFVRKYKYRCSREIYIYATVYILYGLFPVNINGFCAFYIFPLVKVVLRWAIEINITIKESYKITFDSKFQFRYCKTQRYCKTLSGSYTKPVSYTHLDVYKRQL